MMDNLGALTKELVLDLIHRCLPECVEKNAQKTSDYWIIILLKPQLHPVNDKQAFKRVIRVVDFAPPLIKGALVYRVDPVQKIVTLEQPLSSPPQKTEKLVPTAASAKSFDVAKNYLIKI